MGSFIAGGGLGRVRRQQPRELQSGKGAGPAEAAQSAVLPAGHPDLSSPGPALQWNLPGGWKEIAPGQMRIAEFQVAGAGGQGNVSVVPLPGEAGGNLANVNRWRGQVGQSPVTEAELGNLAQPVEVAGQKAQLFEQSGPVPGSGGQSRILAAVLRREGIAWFFKMTGDDALVAQQKPAFVDFLKSLKFGAAAAAPGQLPPFHPPIGTAGAGPMAAASVIPTGPASPGPGKAGPASAQGLGGGPGRGLSGG